MASRYGTDMGMMDWMNTDDPVEILKLQGASPRARFAALVHDLGKGLTPESEWPRHFKHEETGVTPVAEVALRFELPDDWTRLAVQVARHHLRVHRIAESSPRGLARFYRELECSADERKDFLMACQADAQGRLGMKDNPYPQAAFLEGLFAELDTVVRLPEENADVWMGRQVALVKQRVAE